MEGMLNRLDVVLPVLLVVILFLLKLGIGRDVTLRLCFLSLYELPVDVVFLAITFSVSTILASSTHMNTGLVQAFVFLIGEIVSVFFWRSSTALFDRGRYAWSAVVAIINASLSGYCLVSAVSVLLGTRS